MNRITRSYLTSSNIAKEQLHMLSFPTEDKRADKTFLV